MPGNKFIFTHAGLAFVFIAMAVAMFVMSSFSPLISIYIRDSLHAGTIMFGVISAMVGVGLIVGTQLVTRLVRSRSKAHVVLWGLFSLGIAAALLGAFRNTPMAAVSTFTMGFALPSSGCRPKPCHSRKPRQPWLDASAVPSCR